MHPYLQKLRDEDAPLYFDEARDALGERLPLLRELVHTEQDPSWHAEGNVEVHTRMVLEELEAALGRGEHDLSARERFLVRVATLLHDVAKPLTTTRRVRDGQERVVAPHHAARGASYIAYRGLSLGLERADLLEIMGLVSAHHDPKFLIIKSRREQAYWRLARVASMRGLYALELADMRGRRCADRQEQIEYIELFKLGAQEAGVWQGELPQRAFMRQVRQGLRAQGLEPARVERALMEGLAALEREEIYTPEEAVARAYALEERFSRVVVLMGPSGCGKTSWAREQLPQMGVIALDELREEVTGDVTDQSKNVQVAHLGRERLREHLREQEDVIWDATNLRREFRAPITGLARDYKAHITLVLFHMPPEVFFARNRERARKVPAGVLERQLDIMSWPGLDEAHRVMLVDEHGAIVSDSRASWEQA